jgi:hypothetical protein
MINEVVLWLNINGLALTTIFTLVLAAATIALAYVSYLQVKASNRQISETRLIRKIDKHNEQLRNLIQQWEMYLPKPPDTGLYVYPLFLLHFESDPLFPDLESHLPPKFEDLMKKWKHYKDLCQKYHQKQTEIISKINGLISNMQKEKIDYVFPSQAVYFKAIELLTDKKYYEYSRQEMFKREPKVYKLFYRDIEGANNIQLSKESSPPTEKEIDKIKEQHENVSNIAKKEYENDIRNLVDIENELKQMFTEFKVRLNELTRYPEYNNMDCEYIFPR